MFGAASLGRRLLVAAVAFIAIALVIAAVAIGFVLHRFVQGQIDQRLDTQIVFLTSMLRADGEGRLSLTGNADGPPFERPRRGWYWDVTGPRNVLRSASLENQSLNAALPDVRDRPPPKGRKGEDERDARPRPADGPGPDGQSLHYRIKSVAIAGVSATIIASAPRAAVLGPLREAMTTLAISLLVLGAALVSAMLLQIRLGLRPLTRLQHAVADIRSGRAESIQGAQPAEIRPLVGELNALLSDNNKNLERARRHVANLAHGLKTPLATLALVVPPRNMSQGGASDPAQLVETMERRIRHHLGRARIAAFNAPMRAHTAIAPRIRDIGDVMTKVHAARHIELTIDIGDKVYIACEPQDFDEMAGNILENAFNWTRSKVAVSVMLIDRRAVLCVEDDGPGLSPEEVQQVLRPGQRLDETAAGFGFGLSITQELVELYGGSLEFGRSQMNGLKVSLSLPVSA